MFRVFMKCSHACVFAPFLEKNSLLGRRFAGCASQDSSRRSRSEWRNFRQKLRRRKPMCDHARLDCLPQCSSTTELLVFTCYVQVEACRLPLKGRHERCLNEVCRVWYHQIMRARCNQIGLVRALWRREQHNRKCRVMVSSNHSGQFDAAGLMMDR